MKCFICGWRNPYDYLIQPDMFRSRYKRTRDEAQDNLAKFHEAEKGHKRTCKSKGRRRLKELQRALQ